MITGNCAYITAIVLLWLFVAYKIYGRFIERLLIKPDDKRKTPAHRFFDKVDYCPAKPMVLFGHHFASIAGAGPIIGPVIAVAVFGYGFSLLWIAIGVIFVGAVHDYTTCILSVRNDGRSVSDITGDLIGRSSRVFFQLFVWITLVFVIAVFVIAASKTFLSDPRIVIPAFGLIPLAVGFGWLTSRAGLSLVSGTVIALLLLVGFFILGEMFPIAIHKISEQTTTSGIDSNVISIMELSNQNASLVWMAVLIIYGIVAAVMPVWILLQPRDYLGYWILAFGMIAGFAGLFITGYPINAPFVTSLSSSKGPIWPMLFILVACGAVSGFHSLVSSGTTSKQLDLESHARPVVFGAMVVEGALAVLALMAVSAGLAWQPEGAGKVPSLSAFMTQVPANPIGAFATGFGVFTKPFMGEAGNFFGVIMINAFVLTTLDTSMRLARFITAELAGPYIKPLKNRYVSTLLVAGCAFALASTGSVGTLWKMFGASNQLVAALAMIIVTIYLVKNKRPARYTLFPALFMLFTTIAALIWQGYIFLSGEKTNLILVVAALLLLVLAVFVSIRGFTAYRKIS